MTYTLRVSRRAARHIRAASTWWLENRDKAPSAFADDLDDAFRLIAELPRTGEPVHHSKLASARRLLLARTRYHLYYSVDDDGQTVRVLALWHTSRGKLPRL